MLSFCGRFGEQVGAFWKGLPHINENVGPCKGNSRLKAEGPEHRIYEFLSPAKSELVLNNNSQQLPDTLPAPPPGRQKKNKLFLKMFHFFAPKLIKPGPKIGYAWGPQKVEPNILFFQWQGQKRVPILGYRIGRRLRSLRGLSVPFLELSRYPLNEYGQAWCGHGKAFDDRAMLRKGREAWKSIHFNAQSRQST